MRYSSLFSWATTLWFAVLSLMTVGCRSVVRVPETAQATTQPAAVFPDYRDVVIPPNIAPLNFQVNQPAEEIVVQVAGKRGTPLVAAAGEAGKLRSTRSNGAACSTTTAANDWPLQSIR